MKRQLLTDAAVGSLAGIAAGLIAGLGARVMMRMVADGVADGVGVRPVFTVEGTAAILFFGAVAGAPFGVIYGALAGRMPGPAQARAPLFGALMLAVIGPVFFLGSEEFFSTGRVALFAALFPLYGVALGLAFSPSRHVVSVLPLAARAAVALVALLGSGLVAVGLVSLALQSTGLLPM